MSWAILPSEIRLLILETLASDHHARLASCASVSKEWQSVIEKRNFRQLKLRFSRIDGLKNIVRQRHLVKRIWLNIELPRYACRSCEGTESFYWTSRNEGMVRNNISRLFSILSTWDRAGELALEISAQSSSDSEHWFKDLYFGSDDEMMSRDLAGVSDPKHGWMDGRRIKGPPGSAISRLFARLDLRFPNTLPEVRAVTSLVIRRHFRLRLAPQSLQFLISRLPHLDHMTYEPWREWVGLKQGRYDREYRAMFEAILPKTLKKVLLFEDFSDNYIPALQVDATRNFPVPRFRIAEPALGAALAHRSLHLTHLSIAFMIDARHFFRACRPQWTWTSLQSLALTSPVLYLTENQEAISLLLRDAGVAVPQMPSLHTMTLWNGRKGEACAFVYKTADYSVTWRSTWDLKLHPRVIETWEGVAANVGRSNIRFEKQDISNITINSHGDAIHHLNLPVEVVDALSLWQIRREGKSWGRTWAQLD